MHCCYRGQRPGWRRAPRCKFARCGLAIVTPGALLERLDRDGQLDVAPEWSADLDSGARFYGIAVVVDELD